MRRLVKKGLVKEGNYLSLTEKGTEVAMKVEKLYQIASIIKDLKKEIRKLMKVEDSR
ncbi:hypothetical protein [Sulfuracidifex metallicus]|uniref:hypothetical protein n=1 Tax=Sulfuracidifex metallicus TaxID=47303 RepID=UPI000B2D4B37|nr:hypothetical protein [Sulfuracidifex metallicus]WOE51809.1 hypothetical protein RQ359_001144 [Sulfuracidifex metallicus DSM 6482 = JCM 9184]